MFTISQQSAPFAKLATFSRLQAACKGAQILANNRQQWVRVDDEARRTCTYRFGPERYTLEPFIMYSLRTHSRGSKSLAMRAEALSIWRRFAAFQRRQGKNLARAIALFSEIYRKHEPAFDRIRKHGNELRAHFRDGRPHEHVATASWYERDSTPPTITRDFRSAHVRGDGSRYSGAYCVEIRGPGEGWSCTTQTRFGLELQTNP